jgi:peptidoglycan/xylan/chitin deacetylase (PgdA/CDA1 family)
MRTRLAAMACLAALSLVSRAELGGTSLAQGITPQCQNPRAIGVSRTVEIDTTTGPRFGSQYGDSSFLEDHEVVLTFDDGPMHAHTRAVLDALDAHCTKATFFMVGRMAMVDPEAAREVDRRGHTIGTHTLSHANLRQNGPRAESEFELGLSAVTRAIGKPPAPFFRFPYLADTRPMQALLAKRGFAIFSIDADSVDYRTRDPVRMRRTLLSHLGPKGKGILLFHDIQASTVAGISAVLDELKAKGYRVVHLVPKVPATTVAAYDDAVAGMASRKAAIAAANPLAKRSVVWPVATGTPRPHPAAAAGRGKNRAAPIIGGPGASPEAGSSAARADPAPAGAPEPGLRGPADPDWMSRTFPH